jgi:hypothetical protein
MACFFGRQPRCCFECSFPTRDKRFKLVTLTSVMISTQSRLLDNCSCIVLPSAFHGGRLSSCSTERSRASKKSSFTHVICLKNKPFCAENLKAEKQWRSHQSGYRRRRCFCLLTYPRIYVRQLLGEFSRAICKDAN